MWTLTNVRILCCHCYQLWHEEGWSEKKWEVTQKLRKGEQSFLYVTDCLNLIHIAIKFHQDIPYGYLVMACI